METYKGWASIPGHLSTKTRLAKEFNKRPARGQKPAAYVRAMTPQGWDTFPLYDIEAAVPRRQPTEAQLETLEKARRAAMTTDCCNLFVGRVDWRYKGDRCYDCWQAEEDKRIEAFIERSKIEASLWARDILARDDVVILDTETTGLNGEIVDIAVIDTKGNVLLDTLVRPVEPIPAGVTAIHGIDDEMVKDAPTWPEVYERLRPLLLTHLVVIYNANFDTGRILHCNRLHGLEPLAYQSECAMERYAEWYGAWSEYHGSFTWQRLGGGHRALGDCQETLKVLQEMAK